MDFINLPNLVLDEILTNLSVDELKIVRTTSRTLNSIINRKEHLKRIKTYIKNTTRLENILTYSRLQCPIYNVVYDFDYCDFPEFSRALNINKFIKKFQSTLTKLTCKTFDPEFMKILSVANLESLNVSYLGKPLEINNMNRLRKLKIKAFDANVQDWVATFLQKCPNLIYIRLPIWQAVQESAKETPKPSEALINFIGNRKNKLTIDFGGFEHSWELWEDIGCWMRDSGPTNTRIFRITPTNLLQMCQPSNRGLLKLRNVQLNSLPDLTGVPFHQSLSNLDACIESIVMIQPDRTYSQKFFPPKAEIKLGICGGLDEFIAINPELNITSIHWIFSGTYGVKNNPNVLNLDPKIYRDLFKNDQQELIQHYIAQAQPIYVQESPINLKLDFCAAFPRLKILNLFSKSGFRDYNYTLDEWDEMGKITDFDEDFVTFEF